MKRLFFISLTLFLLAPALYAQTGSIGTLPLVRNDKASKIGNTAPPDSVKYSRALRVYNRLVAARGDYRYPVPKFVMSRAERMVAGMFYQSLEIVLEEKAYDVCSRYGDAALATLLGHELTHYYENHAWRRGFAHDFRDLKVGITLDSLRDDVTNETQADYLGGFLAYSAGYPVFEKGTELMGDLYAAYGLPAQINGYPSLPDRQMLNARSTEKLRRLVDLYDMANLMTAIGKYSEAYAFYQYVLQEYQSREIYNNVGVAAVLDALQYFSDKEMRFHLPLELDLESNASRGLDNKATERDRLLGEAIRHFNAAIHLDPDYAPAYLNKACAYFLLGDTARAYFYAASEAREVARKTGYAKTETDVEVLLGILEASGGDTTAARRILTAAQSKGSALAAANLRVLLNEPAPPAVFAPAGKAERIDSLSLAMVTNPIMIDDEYSVKVLDGLWFHQNPKLGRQSRLLICDSDLAGFFYIFHLTNPGYTGKTLTGIGMGDTRERIVKAYGPPKRSVETPQGQLLAYAKILFVLGADGGLERWANYMFMRK